MELFSSLHPEQIDLSRTSAQGVAALRAFLEYAEKQKLPLDPASAQKAPAHLGGAADSICAFLNGNGYATARDVGHSAYRIDVAVVDPENPEEYTLGILLDGPCYRAAQTTRDREIAQIGVLNGLGWRITRVWTMDWWDNPGREKERLLKLLQKKEEAHTDPPAVQPVPPEDSPKLASAVPMAPADPKVPAYTPARLTQSRLEAEDFLLPRYAAGIRKKVLLTLEKEAPVSASLLTRRVVGSYGISRAGSRIQSYMEGIYRSLGLRSTAQGDQTFYWNPDQDPEEYQSFRRGDSEQTRREAREIPVQEAAGAAMEALRQQLSLSQEDLLREGAKLLGYPRMGQAISALMAEGVRYAQWKGRIVPASNGNFTLAGE